MTTFQVIPAIDIRDGRCVRLIQGDYARETRYTGDPVDIALRWESLGATLIHVVDLDGARDGKPANAALIAAMCNAVKVPVEVSGGMRSIEVIAAAFEMGAARVQIGSAAVTSGGLVDEATVRFPGRIVVSIDARHGQVMTDGWTQASGVDALELARRMADLGVPRLMYTDIGRDGMLQGPNIEVLRRLVAAAAVPIVASGGIATLEQLRLVAATGCEGAIIGKALYEGAIDIAEALRAVEPVTTIAP